MEPIQERWWLCTDSRAEIGPFETKRDVRLARKALMVYGPSWLEWRIEYRYAYIGEEIKNDSNVE